MTVTSAIGVSKRIDHVSFARCRIRSRTGNWSDGVAASIYYYRSNRRYCFGRTINS